MSIIRLFFINIILLLCLNALPVQSLTLSPGVLRIETEPNKPQTFVIKIFNEGREKITVTPSVQAFIIDSTSGKKVLRPPSNALNSIAQYIEFSPESFVLEARQVKSFPLQLKIPSGILGGNHALVFFRAVPYRSPLFNQQARIAIGVRLGTTILQESKGTLVIRSRIDKVKVTTDKSTSELQLHIINEGNTFINASAIVTIMDSQEKHFYGTIQIPATYVLRGQKSILKAKLPPNLKPGSYKLLITYQYRDKSVSIFSSFKRP